MGGGGGGSFFSSPIRVVDFTNFIQVARLGGTADSYVRHLGGTATVGIRGLLRVTNNAGSYVDAPDQPQWHDQTGIPTNENDASNWSVACTAINFISGVTIVDFFAPDGTPIVFGEYWDLNTFQRDWRMAGVPNNTPGYKEADITFQYADRLTKTDIRGQHTIKLIYERL